MLYVCPSMAERRKSLSILGLPPGATDGNVSKTHLSRDRIKKGLRGFRPGLTQTSLSSYRIFLEA